MAFNCRLMHDGEVVAAVALLVAVQVGEGLLGQLHRGEACLRRQVFAQGDGDAAGAGAEVRKTSKRLQKSSYNA